MASEAGPIQMGVQEMNRWLVVVLGTVLLVGPSCSPGPEGAREERGALPEQGSEAIDVRSYRLGSIGAFAEMVGAGVKKLALSAPMEAQEMDALLVEAERIAKDHGVELYRERDFLTTDLFPPELTEGKEVLLIYNGETAEEYLQLKAEKQELVAQDAYHGEARLSIARRFGAFLSYSDEKISALLEGEH